MYVRNEGREGGKALRFEFVYMCMSNVKSNVISSTCCLSCLTVYCSKSVIPYALEHPRRGGELVCQIQIRSQDQDYADIAEQPKEDVFQKSSAESIVLVDAGMDLSSNETTAGVWWLLQIANFDIQYARWLSWLFTPVVVAFVLPALVLIFLYMTALFLVIYKWHRHDLKHAYERDVWEGARQTLAAFWEAQGWIWHGYEIEGLDNIPSEGPALIIYYHGAIPIDFYYLVSKCILYKGRLIRPVGDRFLFKIPGWSKIIEAFKIVPGTVQSCAAILKEGNVLAISPGGVYEAQFGNENYELMWKNRMGFAKVAIEAQVPIIPMFTQNIREGFRTLQWGRWFWLWFYSKTRIPLAPVYGFFPVKLKTFIGKPIQYDPTTTPEDLTLKTAQALQRLIAENQRIPGSIIRGILDRVWYTKPQKVT